MKTGNISKLFQIVEEAITLAEDKRSDFVTDRCGSDLDLRDEALRMIEAAKTAPDFMSEPASEASKVIESIGTSSEEEVPESIGPYQIVRLLGKGGMGNVYLGVQQLDSVKRSIAIKVIKRGMDTDTFVARFKAERNILASMNHPNVARLIDVGATDDGRAFFAMEFVDGLPVTEYADQHLLTIDQRIQLFDTICRAVHHAHQNLVVHRDLKPSNILLTKTGTVKLLDFGIAKLLDPNHTDYTVPATVDGQILVTPEYASPEQLEGRVVSTSTDVYSLGILLYNLLSGTLPFGSSRDSRIEFMKKRETQDARRPSSAVSELDGGTLRSVAESRGTSGMKVARVLAGDLDTIVMKALRRSPEDRYASVEQLREDLERYIHGVPIQAKPATLSYSLRKFYGRNRKPLLVAMAVLLSVVSLTAFYVYDLAQQRAAARAAANRAESVTAFVVQILEQAVKPDASGSDENIKAVLSLIEPVLDNLDVLGNDEVAQVTIINTVGGIVTSTYAVTEAVELLRRALPIVQKPGFPQEERADTMFEMARAHFHTVQYDSAYHYASIAYDIFRNVTGELSPKTLESLKYLAWSSGSVTGEYEIHEDAISAHVEAYGVSSNEVAGLLNELGQGNPERGEEYLRRALSIHESRNALDSEAAGIVMANLSLKIEAQEPAYALELQVKAVRILESTLGEFHPKTIATLSNVGAMLVERARFAEADSVYQELNRKRELLDPDGRGRSPISAFWHARAKLGLQDYQAVEDLMAPELGELALSDFRYLPLFQVYLQGLAGGGKQGEAIAAIASVERQLLEETDSDSSTLARLYRIASQ